MNILFYDVESTGLPRKDQDTGETVQPNITQLGFILERFGVDVMTVDALIKPDNWFLHQDQQGLLPPSIISHKAMEVTGITPELCEEQGIPIADAVELFVIAAEHADVIVCHNNAFDLAVMKGEYKRLQPRCKTPEIVFAGKPSLCTMKTATPICKIAKKGVGRTMGVSYKWPKLEEAIPFFFDGEQMVNAHSAIADINYTRRLFHKLVEIGAFDKEVGRMEKAGTIRQGFLAELQQVA